MRHFKNTENGEVYGYELDQQELINSAVNDPVMIEVEAPASALETAIERDKLLDEWVRTERDKRLFLSDWTQLPDADVDKTVWQAYRQALRDVPQQEGFPDNVVWPALPVLTD